MEDDAQRALKEIKEYDGHRLSLSVAKKKIKDRKKTGAFKVLCKNCNSESSHAVCL